MLCEIPMKDMLFFCHLMWQWGNNLLNQRVGQARYSQHAFLHIFFWGWGNLLLYRKTIQMAQWYYQRPNHCHCFHNSSSSPISIQSPEKKYFKNVDQIRSDMFPLQPLDGAALPSPVIRIVLQPSHSLCEGTLYSPQKQWMFEEYANTRHQPISTHGTTLSELYGKAALSASC